MLLYLLTSCGKGSDRASLEISGERPEKDHVEVLYFHGKKRCATCKAIENTSKEVVDSMFADEISDGKIIYRIVDISTPDGEAIADKYEVTWSSLYVNCWKDGKEIRSDMTEFGFANALNHPEVFKKGIEDKITQMLK